jgi:hypothetical protein
MTESQLLEKVSNAIGVAGQAGKHAFGNCWGSDNQATRATPNQRVQATASSRA